MNQRVLLFFSLVVAPLLLFSQERTLTGREVALESRFVMASQEKVLGNYEEAAALYKTLLDENPDNATVAWELGRVYYALEEMDDALRYATLAWELEKNTWFALFLADLYEEADQPAKAAELFLELIKLEPDNDWHYQKAGYFLAVSGQLKEAVEIYDALQDRIGVTEDVSRRKYNLYLSLGKEKKAEEELQNLIETSPTEIDWHHQLALFYEESGRTADALEVYQHILKLDPQDGKARMALAKQTPDGEMDPLQAIGYLFEDPSTDLDTKIKRILPLVESLTVKPNAELNQKLTALTELLMDQYPEEARVYALAADLSQLGGQPTLAIEQYSRAVELEKSVFQTREQLLFLCLETGQYSRLIEQAEAALDLFPNRPEIYLLAAQACYYSGRYEEALPYLRQAGFLSSHSETMQARILSWKGSTLARMGKTQESDELFEEALKLTPDAGAIGVWYATHLCLANRELEKAASLIPGNEGSFSPELLEAQALLAFREGQLADALAQIEKAIQLEMPYPRPQLLELYGDMLYAAGKPGEAVEQWEKALNLDYHASSLKRKVADAKTNE